MRSRMKTPSRVMTTMGAAATPAPYSPDLEQAWLPDRRAIADAVRRLVAV